MVMTDLRAARDCELGLHRHVGRTVSLVLAAGHPSGADVVTSGNHRVNQTTGGTPACFTCHGTLNTTTKPWGVNWTQVQCTACHINRTAPSCR